MRYVKETDAYAQGLSCTSHSLSLQRSAVPYTKRTGSQSGKQPEGRDSQSITHSPVQLLDFSLSKEPRHPAPAAAQAERSQPRLSHRRLSSEGSVTRRGHIWAAAVPRKWDSQSEGDQERRLRGRIFPFKGIFWVPDQ